MAERPGIRLPTDLRGIAAAAVAVHDHSLPNFQADNPLRPFCIAAYLFLVLSGFVMVIAHLALGVVF